MHELNLLIAAGEGALVRVLGTIERRGFAFAALSTTATPQGLRLAMTLHSDARAAEVLLRQLRRLVDVREVALLAPRPSFRLPPPPLRAASAPAATAGSRRGLSFLGIPERVSGAEKVA
jgi:acetolactate synthase II small subunit